MFSSHDGAMTEESKATAVPIVEAIEVEGSGAAAMIFR
jgi:hypothetical protein